MQEEMKLKETKEELIEKAEKKWLIPVKKPRRIWIVPVLGIIYFIWVLAVFLVPQITDLKEDWAYLLPGPYDADGNWSFASWVSIGIVLYAIFILIEILLLVSWKKKVEAAIKEGKFEIVEEVPEFTVIEQKWVEPELMEGRQVLGFAYPVNLTGGVYANTFMDIDGNNVLKLRTLLAKPCALCEEREICWDDYKDKMRYNVFLGNVECKEGLQAVVGAVPKPEIPPWPEIKPPEMPPPAPAPPAPPAPEIPAVEAKPRKYPKMYIDIEKIEGIGPIRAKTLREAGIKYTDDLEDADIEKLAEKTWLPERRLRDWRAMAEIMHVVDVGPQFSEVLVRSGIKSIDELAAQEPEKLTRKVKRTIAGYEKRITKAPITVSLVSRWIENAKKMQKKAAERLG